MTITEMNDELRNAIFGKGVDAINDILRRGLDLLNSNNFLVYKDNRNAKPEQFYVTLELGNNFLSIKFYHIDSKHLNDCAAYLNIRTSNENDKLYVSYTSFNVGSLAYVQQWLSSANAKAWMTLAEFEMSKFTQAEKILHQYATTVQNVPNWNTLVAGKDSKMVESLCKMAMEWYFNGSPKDHNVNNH
ncbi:hypothetical protein MA9V1_099 [Chryseobacterium phage MA9V-1]|nr:hypothetical protein MA9V1_099 [Chryseobacterium phage MA9V-1]